MPTILKMFKQKKGFTLAEMIISVAVITFISIFIIQLFIVAKNLNQKAGDLDKAVFSSQSVLEVIKSEQSPGQIKNNSYMKNALIKENGKTTEISIYYDEEWNVLKKSTSEDTKDDNKAFVLKAVISPETSGNDSKAIRYFQITISTTKLKAYLLEDIKNKKLYTLKANKYFYGIGEN